MTTDLSKLHIVPGHDAPPPPEDDEAAERRAMLAERAFREWFEATGAGQEGEQAVEHDSLGTMIFRKGIWSYPDMEKDLRKTVEDGMSFGPKLAHDLWNACYQYTPALNDPAQLSQMGRVLGSVVEPLMQTDQYNDLRGQTVGDDFLATLSTRLLYETALKQMDDKTKKALADLNNAENEQREKEGEAGAMEDLADQLDQQDGEGAGDQARQQAQQLRQEAQQAQQQAQQLGQSLGQKMEQQQGAMRQAMRQAAQQAAQQAENVQDAMKAYGIGGSQAGTGMPVEEKLKLANRMKKSEKLAKIAKIAGRMKMIAGRVRKTKINQVPSELVGIETGDDLEWMDSAELARLAHPALRVQWLKDFVDENLTILKVRGREKTGRGPVVIALDDSGSMAGAGEVWAKGVMLAFLQFCKKEKRDVAIIHFASGKNALKTYYFPKGVAQQSYLLDCMEFFFGGGTEFEPWMREALTIVQESRFNKADVICISDGVAGYTPEMEEWWNRMMREREMRAYGVLIGDMYGRPVMEKLCGTSEHVFQIDDVWDESEDLAALNTLFAV